MGPHPDKPKNILSPLFLEEALHICILDGSGYRLHTVISVSASKRFHIRKFLISTCGLHMYMNKQLKVACKENKALYKLHNLELIVD